MLNTTYKAKNADYGDSFAKVRAKFPNAILIRLNDKLERLERLYAGAVQQVKDESIDDTLLDLANYCIMELVERKQTPATGNVYIDPKKIMLLSDLKHQAEHYFEKE